MSTEDIHVNQTATGSSGVTQIGVQYTGGVHHHYAPGSEPKRTTVTLDLGLEQVDVSKLVALISGLTQAGIQDISLVGVRLGSLIVTLEMPSQAARTLGYLALTRPELFAEFKLRGISIDLPPAPPGGPASGEPGRSRPRRRSSSSRGLELIIKRLVLLTGGLVAVGAILVVIWYIQHPPTTPACLLTSMRGAQPILAGPSDNQAVIGEIGESPGLTVTGQIPGEWWRVRLADGQEGWVLDRAMNLSGTCEGVPLVQAGDIVPEPCTATVVWPNGPSRLSGVVREGPSPDFPIVGTLQEGVPVVLLERSEDFSWWHVINEEAAVEGWMPESSLALSGACDVIPAAPPQS